MEETSSLKTAFAEPHGRKYHYKVMPFGIVNGPTIYVIMVYDFKDHWDNELLFKFNIKIDDNNNTTIIIDDTFGFAESYEIGLAYVEAILIIAIRYNLSWKPSKRSFFPDRVELLETI